MSVSGWETRSVASNMTADDRREHRQHPTHMQRQQRPQSRPPPPQYQSRHISSTASQSSHVSHRDDTTPRHSSFPVQPQPQQQHLQYHRHAAEHKQLHQPPPPHQQQRPQQHRRQDPDHRAGDYERERPANGQRRSFMAEAQPKQPRQQPRQKQQQQQQPSYDHPNQYVEAQRAPPYYEEYDPLPAPLAPPPPPSPPHRQERRQPRLQQQQQYQYQQAQAPPQDDYYNALPLPQPPPPFERPAVAPPPPLAASQPVQPAERPPRQRAAPQPVATPPVNDEEPVNIDDALLGKRWSVHVISHLFHFQRQELGEYANELVKFLRGHALMTYEQEFGYNVMIRFTAECIAVHVVEARDLHAEFLIEKMEQPQRPENKPVFNGELEDDELRQRSGDFVVYFPKAAEDSPTKIRLGGMNAAAAHRRFRSQSNDDGSETSLTSTATASHMRGDPKYAFLLRGNEELMSWVSSWVQRRFQCVVGRHVVRITKENLRRVARNWVIEALERDERVDKANQRKAEKLQKLPSGDHHHHLLHDGTARPAKAPLLLKYQTTKTSDAVKSFTLTMPWGTVRRVHTEMDRGVSSALGTVPEVLERLEQTYFGNLQKDLEAMELVGFEMEEVEVDTQGKIKFSKSSMIHSILQSYLDIFAVQQMPDPTQDQTTF